MDWSARLVGGDTVDPDYTVRVRAAITDHGLTDRVAVTGPLVGAELAAEWFATDLLVHPSWSETYGIVVLEALAHGVPAVVVSGTGAVEALAAGRDSIAGPAGGHGCRTRRCSRAGGDAAYLADRSERAEGLAGGGSAAANATSLVVANRRLGA